MIRASYTTQWDSIVAVQNELGLQLVKAAYSIRCVPLHKALIDISLPKTCRIAPAGRHEPVVSRHAKLKMTSAIMSKRFGYCIRSRGIGDDGLDFHAPRTEFLVRLTRAKVPDRVRKGLVWHEQTDVTHKNYFWAGETTEDMKEDVDRIDIALGVVIPRLGLTYRQSGCRFVW